MYLLKFLFKLLVVCPAILLASCTAGGYAADGGEFNWLRAIIFSSIVFIAFCVWDAKKLKRNFEKYASSLGITPEYVACYEESGIAIDNTNGMFFAGTITKGKLFEFGEISSIESEDAPFGRRMKYAIHINTRNFDFPRLTVGFAGNKPVRDEAYAKLRAALNFI